MAKPQQFTTKDMKIAFVLLYIKGNKVDAWAKWICQNMLYKAEGVPMTCQKLFNLLEAQFGDPQKEMMSRQELDHCMQTTSVGDYLVRFRAIAISTGYSENDLTHRYIKGLKGHICKACFTTRPIPKTFTDWANISYEFQAQFDLETSYHTEFKGGKATSTYAPPQKRMQGTFRPSQRSYFQEKKTNEDTGAGEPMEIDRAKQQCHFCRQFGHIQKDCYRKLGLCLHCRKSGYIGKNCPKGNSPRDGVKVRASKSDKAVTIVKEASESESGGEGPSQGFVTDL